MLDADPRLLVPATADLLHGWCGPVVLEDGDPAVLMGPDVAPEDRRVGPWLVAPQGSAGWRDYPSGPWDILSARTEMLSLDLSRAECADRAARVHLGSPDEVTISTDPRGMRRTGADGLIVWSGNYPAAASDEADAASLTVPHVPALADLDPTDDSRLPDGSRLVDRLALAAVVRAVAPRSTP